MTRGGKRTPGPGKAMGRPKVPKSEQKVPYSFRLRPDLAGWLRTRKNATRDVERALDAYIAGLK